RAATGRPAPALPLTAADRRGVDDPRVGAGARCPPYLALHAYSQRDASRPPPSGERPVPAPHPPPPARDPPDGPRCTPICLGGYSLGIVKTVPGRKTDLKEAEWIADLLQHGLLRPSFVPPAPQRELRELTRYRMSLGEERARL